jgi:hypothetical protein
MPTQKEALLEAYVACPPNARIYKQLARGGFRIDKGRGSKNFWIVIARWCSLSVRNESTAGHQFR